MSIPLRLLLVLPAVLPTSARADGPRLARAWIETGAEPTAVHAADLVVEGAIGPNLPGTFSLLDAPASAPAFLIVGAFAASNALRTAP